MRRRRYPTYTSTTLLGVEVEPPDLLGEHGPREHPARAAHEVLEQRVLARGQAHAPCPAAHLASGRIKRQVAHAEHRARALPTAPEEGAHPGQKLLEGERLGQ